MATNRLFTEGEVTKLGGELNSSAHFLIFQLRHPRRIHKQYPLKSGLSRQAKSYWYN